MVGWVDVLGSDFGDFRRRCTVDSFSFALVLNIAVDTAVDISIENNTMVFLTEK